MGLDSIFWKKGHVSSKRKKKRIDKKSCNAKEGLGDPKGCSVVDEKNVENKLIVKGCKISLNISKAAIIRKKIRVKLIIIVSSL